MISNELKTVPELILLSISGTRDSAKDSTDTTAAATTATARSRFSTTTSKSAAAVATSCTVPTNPTGTG